jgi:osmotically-inducible protein OsmY
VGTNLSKSWRVAGLAFAVAAAGCGDDEVARLEAYSRSIDELRGSVDEARAEVDARETEVGEANQRLADAREALSNAEDALAEVERKASQVATDPVLFRLVQQRLLEDDALEGVAISASVTGGVVSLAGEVPSAALRERAAEVAQSVPGVASVTNRIQVLAPVSTPGPEATP